MATTNRLGISPALEKTAATILDSYSSFSSVTQKPSDLFLIQNLTDADVMISFDGGAHNHMPLSSNSYILIDLNQYIQDLQMKLAAGTDVAVKRLVAGAAPTSGSVWITVFYAIRN